MELLKKENWWIWLFLMIFGNGSATIVLAALLGLLKKKAWYANWKNWVLGLALLIFPAIVMFYILMIQTTSQVAAKLGVKGHEYYLSPYIWLLLVIIPIIGWLIMIILYLYLNISILIALYKGKAI